MVGETHATTLRKKGQAMQEKGNSYRRVFENVSRLLSFLLILTAANIAFAANGPAPFLGEPGLETARFLDRVGFTFDLPDGYSVTIKAGKDFVGGCINRDVKRLLLRIVKDGEPIADIQFGAWYEDSQIDLGVFTPLNDWSSCDSFSILDVFDGLRDFLFSALVEAGIDPDLSTEISEGATPVLIGLLTAFLI